MQAHDRFLNLCLKFKGKVAISGYDLPCYREALAGWNRHDTRIQKGTGCKTLGGQKPYGIEILWDEL